MTDLLTYLPIDQGTDCWVNTIHNMPIPDRKEASENAKVALAQNGFDIERDAEELRNMYLTFAKES